VDEVALVTFVLSPATPLPVVQAPMTLAPRVVVNSPIRTLNPLPTPAEVVLETFALLLAILRANARTTKPTASS
jgi:hypothetical protein